MTENADRNGASSRSRGHDRRRLDLSDALLRRPEKKKRPVGVPAAVGMGVMEVQTVEAAGPPENLA